MADERIIVEFEAETTKYKKELDEAIKKNEELGESAAKGVKSANDEYAKGIDGLKKAIEDEIKLINKLVAAQKKSTNPKEIKEYGKQLAFARDKLADFEGKLADLQKPKPLFSAGALTALTLAGAAIATIGVKAVKAAADYEVLTASFAAFLGDTKKAEKALTILEKFSLKTAFSTDEVNQAGKSLLSYGVGLDELGKKLEVLGNISAGTGEDFNQLAIIYGRSQEQGSIAAKDFNALIDAGVPIVETLSEEFGVAEDQVREFGKQGKISIEGLDKAFESLTKQGGKFEKSTEILGDTAISKFDRIKNSVNNVVLSIGKGLLPSVNNVLDLFIKENKVVEDVGKNFDDLRSNFILLTGALKNGNLSVEARAKLIGQINTEYKDYLPNLLTDKTTNEELETAINAVNQELIQRAVLTRAQADIAKISDEIARAQIAIVDAQIGKAKLLEESRKDGIKTAQQIAFETSVYTQTIDLNNAIIVEQTKELTNLQNKYGDLADSLKVVGNLTKETEPDGDGESKNVEDLTDAYKELADEIADARNKRNQQAESDEQKRKKTTQEQIAAEKEYQQIITDFQNQQRIEARAGDPLKSRIAFAFAEIGALNELDQQRIEQINEKVKTEVFTVSQGEVEKINVYKQSVATRANLLSTLQITESDLVKTSVGLFLEANEQYIQAGQQLVNEFINLANQNANAAISALESQREFENEVYEERLTELDDLRERREITENDYQRQVAETEKQRLESEERIDKAQKKLRREQAIAQRAQAAFSIILNTATGITAALASVPPNVILSAIIGGIGAAQLAAVLGAPLPAYAKGTKGTPDDEMAIVGEKGPELIWMPRGSKVLHNKGVESNPAMIDAMFDGRLNDYIHQNYVAPELLKASKETQIEREIIVNNTKMAPGSGGSIYYDVLNASIDAGRRGTKIKNVDALAVAIAREISNNQSWQ